MAKKDDNGITRDGAHVLVGTPAPIADNFSTPGAVRVTMTDNFVEISDEERAVLRVLLDRQRTSHLMHGGLKSLLTLDDKQASTLLKFLERV